MPYYNTKLHEDNVFEYLLGYISDENWADVFKTAIVDKWTEEEMQCLIHIYDVYRDVYKGGRPQ